MILFMPNKGLAIDLQPSERTQLEQWESAHGTPQQVALRCRIILGAVAGQQNVAIAEGLGVSRPTVQLWRKRVHEKGIGEVWEIAPGRGRKVHYTQEQRDRIIKATLQSKPKGMTHWSCRLMAEAQGVSKNTVNRLWQLHNIKPHLSRTFKLSRDAKFLAWIYTSSHSPKFLGPYGSFSPTPCRIYLMYWYADNGNIRVSHFRY